MGRRITFRERTGNGTVSDEGTPPAVSISEPRVKFVNGEVTTGTPTEGFVACGPGTAYPMEVTADQLAEIFYRVKDAWFTEGTTPSDSVTCVIGGTPPSEFASVADAGGFISSTVRGYCASLVDDAYYTGSPLFVQVVGADPGNLPDTYLNPPYTVDPYGTFYDIADDELGGWQNYVMGGSPSGTWQACAFNHWLLTDSGDSPGGSEYGCWVSEYAELGVIIEITVAISGEVAWVGGDSPFSPDSTLYLGMRAEISVVEGPSYATDYTYGEDLMTFKIKFKLSGVDNFAEANLYTNDNTGSGGSDFVLEATAWWPYAKPDPDNPGETLPVWSEGSGAKL